MSDAVPNCNEHRGTKLDSLPNAPFCDERPDRRLDPLDQCPGKFGLSRDMTSKKASITVSAVNISMGALVLAVLLYNEAASQFRTQHSLCLVPAHKHTQSRLGVKLWPGRSR
jgi:hypothetical protein